MGFRNNLLQRGIMSSDTEVIIRAAAFGKKQLAPVAMTVAATITVAAILNGLITANHAEGATQAYTLPTGEVMEAALTSFMINDDSFDFTIINLSPADANTITVTAADGFTIVGQPVVHSNQFEVSYYMGTGTFRVRKTADETFVAYRMA